MPSKRLPTIFRTPRGPRAERPRGPAANQGAFSHIDPSAFTNSGEAVHLPRWLVVHRRLFVGLTIVAGTIRQSAVLGAPVPGDANTAAIPAIAKIRDLFTPQGYEGLQRFANRFTKPS